ncbi:MAG: prolyl oligopeptidase family serine peptidase [Pseudomonadota bacterium]
MADPFPFPELENDAQAAAAFSAREAARAEAAFCDAAYEADAARAREILEDDSYLPGLRRRGRWIYSYLRNAEAPKGVWRRVPEGTPLSVDAPWDVVFDLDAFCAETGEDWHWRGAETAFFDPEKLLLALAWQGSDQQRYLEWDPARRAPVPGGFDLGPERNSASWIDDNTIFYATSSGQGGGTRSGWPRRVLRLSRGMALEDAPCAFEVRHDDLLGFGHAFRAPGGRTIEAHARVRVIGDDDVTLFPSGPTGKAVLLATPKNAHATYSSTHYAYVAADHGPDPAGTLVLCRVGEEGRRVLFSPAPYRSVATDQIYVGHQWMIWVELDRTVPTVRLLNLEDPSAQPETVPLPCDAQTVWIFPHDAEPTEDGPLQMVTAGFLTPATTWLLDVREGATAVQYEKLSAEPETFDASGMEVQLLSATSDDGTEVPYHIVLPKDRTGPLPVLQYAYGGFGASMSPAYPMLKGPLWLERGGAYVLAYIRGGGEFGKSWHLAAKGRNRMRAFEDFAAVAADLVERGLTEPQRIGCHGGSNGGLLCAVMATRFPEHFGAIWSDVPVADMLRFPLFPAGAGWIDEYGDPDDADDRAALLSYSPVHNVAPAAERPYPPIFVSTNDSDDRVDPSHSRRFAAALIAAGQPAYFHTRAGGHGGGGATWETAQEQSLGIAFLRHALKLA